MSERMRSITIRGLHDASDTGLSGPTTPAVRLALVATLTREAWLLAGREIPMYSRSEAPVSVRPLRASSRAARQ